MADQLTGQWGTLSFAIPDFLQDVRDAVNDFAELLVAALEIANLALEFVKAFIKGFLDPLVALIEAIIDEIVAILRDLRQIGIYITGDWALLGWPPEDLRGGFSAYERRMVARLTDRTDPTRPDVSGKTKVLGFFGYISVDPSEFERLINFILGLIKMFGLSFFPDTSRLPIPVIQDTLYGVQASRVELGAQDFQAGDGVAGTIPLFNFSALGESLGTFNPTPPQKVRVTWVTQPASQKHPFNPFPQLGPSGYLVTVSTIPDGLHLRYARPKANTDKKNANGDKGKKVQPREYGNVLDKNGRPIVLHGGAEMLSFKGSPFEYNEAINAATGVLEDGTCQVFGMLDPASNEIVPLEQLGFAEKPGTPGDGKGEDFILQRTFLIESDVALAQWFAGEYGATFDLADMPQAARFEVEAGSNRIQVFPDGPATHYYVRVWSVGKQIADGDAVPQWDFNATEFRTNVWKSGQPFIIDMKSGDAAVGMPSAPRKITFVNANTADYLHALKTALLVLVLTRADLPLIDDIAVQKTHDIVDRYREGKWVGQAFALKNTGLEDAKHLIGLLSPDEGGVHSLAVPGQDPLAWRTTLYKRIEQLANDIYEQTGPMPEAEAAVVEATTALRGLRWSHIFTEEGQIAPWREALGRVGLEPFTTEPTIYEALNPNNPTSQMRDYGICPNIYSAGIDPDDVDGLFFVDGALVGREGEFTMWDGGKLDLVFAESPAKVPALLARVPESLRRIYEKFVQEDGSLLVSDEYRAWLEDLMFSGRVLSSGDFTPVFVFGRNHLEKLDKNSPQQPVYGMLFARSLMRNAHQVQAAGQANQPILQQAAIALKVATAAFTRAPEDGEWIALRLFDAIPELEAFLAALENWVRGLAEAIQSMADAIIKYIEFVQAQIAELQQLIRRINALIQSLLSFSFALPQFSGLMLLSDGTDGLMADMVAAENKPSDSPRAYGGGLALVIPFGPSFIFDLIAIAAGGQDLDATTQVSRPPDAIGIEGVPPATGAPPSDEPDVL